MRTIGIILIFIMGLLIFSNCTRSLRNNPDMPVDLIHRDTMVNIIVDLRLMDAIIISKQREGDKTVGMLKYQLDNTIMNKYSITREQFDESFYYYESDFKVLDEIYADAITKLSLMKIEPDEYE